MSLRFTYNHLRVLGFEKLKPYIPPKLVSQTPLERMEAVLDGEDPPPVVHDAPREGRHPEVTDRPGGGVLGAFRRFLGRPG